MNFIDSDGESEDECEGEWRQHCQNGGLKMSSSGFASGLTSEMGVFPALRKFQGCGRWDDRNEDEPPRRRTKAQQEIEVLTQENEDLQQENEELQKKMEELEQLRREENEALHKKVQELQSLMTQERKVPQNEKLRNEEERLKAWDLKLQKKEKTLYQIEAIAGQLRNLEKFHLDSRMVQVMSRSPSMTPLGSVRHRSPSATPSMGSVTPGASPYSPPSLVRN